MESKETQFKIGNSGGPGRPKGSKNKITKAFLKALTEDFLEHGKEVLERVRKERPDVYLKLVAMLVPKDLDVKHSGDITVQVVNYSDDALVPVEKHNDLIPQVQALQQVI